MTAYEMAARTSSLTRTEVDEAIEGLVRKGFFRVTGYDEAGNPRYGYTKKGRRLRSWRRRQRIASFLRNAWDGWCDFAGDDERAFWIAAVLIGGCAVLAVIVAENVSHGFGLIL